VSDLTEKMAHEVHEIWSSWMRYMFRKGTMNVDGTWTMPEWAVSRWTRQAKTVYVNLSEEEKQSDRDVINEHHHSFKELQAEVERLNAELDMRTGFMRHFGLDEDMKVWAYNQDKAEGQEE
jgi:hypothetical protein